MNVSQRALLALVLVLAIALMACGPAQTAEPTKAPPTSAPAQAPTSAPATSAPAATVAPTTGSAQPTTGATSAVSVTKPTNTPAPTATPPVPGVTAAPNALKIQFWHVFGTTQAVAMQKLVDKFNAANPSIYVVATNQGSYDPLHQKIMASIQANSIPDLAIGNPGDLADYYNAGSVIGLDDFIKDAKDGFTAAQLAEINQSLYFDKWDNKTIGVSFGRSDQVMFYNVDMLKAAGFTKAPETWDDFDKICAAVSKPPDQNCYAFIPSASTFAGMAWSWGSTYASADEKTAAFNDAGGVAALKWLKNQADKKWAYQPSGSFGDQTDFGNGKVAFTFGSIAGLPFYNDAVKGSKNPFEWSIAAFPHGPNGKSNVDIFGPSVGIFKTTADKQKAAWQFIKFMMSKDSSTEWAMATTYFPPSKSALDNLAGMDAATAKAANERFSTVLPQYKLGTSFLSLGKREPISAAWQGARAIIANMQTAVFTNKSGADFKATDPTEAAKEGADRVNKALADYGK